MIKNSTASSRLQYIDVVRGISMLCIVAGHMGDFDIQRFVFTFHVPVFYLITGYFISTKAPFKSFVIKRAKTLLIPYAITSLLVIFGVAANFKFLQSGVGTKDLMINWGIAALFGAGDTWDLTFANPPIRIQAIGALWFLWASFWGAILLRWLAEKTPRVRVIGVVTIVGASFFAAYQGNFTPPILADGIYQGFWLPLSLLSGGTALLWMYVGWLWRKVGPEIKPEHYEIRFAFTLIALGVWVCFVRDFKSFWLVHGDVGRGMVDICGSICASYALVRICNWLCNQRFLSPVTGYLSWFGKYSLVVLCLHELDLYVLPWNIIMEPIFTMGLGHYETIFIWIGFKVLFLSIGTLVLMRFSLIRSVFGFRN